VSPDAGSGEISPTTIRCNCGHRVVRKDVIQTGLYLSVLGPSYVYVRYRCGRCRRVGEKLVEQESWDPAVLHPARRRGEDADIQRFEEMGEITPEEIIDFHYGLERLGAADRQGEVERA
jgi:DNA-directed RNA polymerase subunit RPC12/RpoP